MSPKMIALACCASLFVQSANAGLVDGFESGLGGWQFLGDASTQTAAIGVTPTEGRQMAFLTTMGQSENPYAGVFGGDGISLLGLPVNPFALLAALPLPHINAPLGDRSGMKTLFFAPSAGVIDFDWNHIGDPSDSAFLTLWSADSAYRFTDWIYNAGDGHPAQAQSTVDLTNHCYWGNGLCPNNNGYNVTTGWNSRSIDVSAPGWYWLGFGVAEVADETLASILAVDNVRFNEIPEPGSLALLLIGLAGMCASRRREDMAVKK